MDKKIFSLALLLVIAVFAIITPKFLLPDKAQTGIDTNQSSSQLVEESNLHEESSQEDSLSDITSEVDSKIEENDQSPAGSIVKQHGMLSVSGSKIVDQNGEVFQLRGMSTHGISWFPEFVNKDAFTTLRDDWSCNSVRLAMYTQNGIYDANRDNALLKKGIDYCIELGMYVIVDWHILGDNNPNTNKEQAKAFFEMISQEYKDCPNIIYELCNEPNGDVQWSRDIKPYCEEIISIIRKNSPNNIIVAGTPTWSQEIDKALADRLSDENVVYALHFYADTHRDDLRNRLKNCENQGLPVLVTEFGLCDASGNGNNNYGESEKWLSLLDELDVGYFNWNLANKNESSSAFKPGTGAKGNWKDGDLSDGGRWYRDYLRKKTS